ncbi:MAG: nitronate monooxygenase [Candidatus Eisenbacteria bacterium]|nr:nitronate monooxygenase [Candidatus Eisenbacteria bacterium]
MKLDKLPQLRIGHLTAKIPIVQGGMGVGISLSGLASAVANEGGIGVIATAGIGRMEPDFASDLPSADARALRNEIRRAKSRTGGIVGVNIMVALTDFGEMVRVAVEEGVDLVIMGAGLPLRLPKTLRSEELKKSKTLFAPKVSSARAVRAIFRFWERNYDHVPDAVVVEGPLAGGHIGFDRGDIEREDHTLERLVTEVIEEVRPFERSMGKNIPVIAAGGIYSGADIRRFLEMGAGGVMMGTRFVTTHECDAHENFKRAYLECGEEGLVIIDSPVGLPGRAISNQFLSDVASGIKKPYRCVWQCLKTCDVRNAPYCIAQALMNAKEGRLDEGFAFAGANAFRTTGLLSVRELILSLVREFEVSAAPAPVSG